MIQERNFMRKLIICVFVFLLAVPAWAIQLQTEDQKALYALGADLAKKLSVFNLSAEEYEFVKQGITDAAAGKKLEAEPEAYTQNINQLFQKRMQAAAQKQKELAKPYLENAAKEKGAQKTASGLIYQEIKAGTGAQPKPSDVVKVHYTGTLIDGKEFDSSVKRGQPVEFPLGQVIPCWTEGVGKMKVGGKAKLVCPSDIAYGDQGRPPIISGGATLIFEVELLDVKKGSAAVAPTPKKPTAPKAKSKK
jgi:FKBP-type peptidyl-prolyl cis-trans isomerase FkpA